MRERDALLRALSRMFRTDPMAVPTFELFYLGAGTLTATVADGVLTLTGIGGAPSRTIALEPLTLEQLLVEVLAIGNGLSAGIDLTQLDALPVRAVTLLDDGPRDVTAEGVSLSRFTNPLWFVFDAVAERLTAAAVDLDAAVAQLNLLTAAGFFADFWGTLTGTVRSGEDDEAYTARQLFELLRPRENNEALALILERDFGLPVREVVDLRREVFTLGGPLRGRYLPGRRFNTATCEIRVDGFPSAVALAAAHTHAAGGVRVFMSGRLDLTGTGSLFGLRGGTAQIGEPPPMQIGVTPIGIGKIGP
jgi:hypothetical protein